MNSRTNPDFFRLQAECPGTKARAGVLRTLHGEVETPVFMPVGTQAAVKSLDMQAMKLAGSRILLANTYHLLLRPGPEVFHKFGGIHKFMNWDGPVLTDSGGFQIFSLPAARLMTEEGAQFRSYVDGRMHMLSPETSIAMQRAISSDIMMVLDQCIPSTASHSDAKAAMELTHRWAVRSQAAKEDSNQALFGIMQGACYKDLRKKSADFLSALDFDGMAIGGLAVGEGKELRDEFTELSASFLPREKPRYLMGVGTPLDILEAVHRGVDMFDCILPVALARTGIAFTSAGKFRLRRGAYKFADEALDSECRCSTCRLYSRAYIHHLIKSSEMTGWQLLSTHNLNFYHCLMTDMRANILSGNFESYYHRMREILNRDDEENPRGAVPEKNTRAGRGQKIGDYEMLTSSQGFVSIRQISSGEVMHSINNPAEEAKLLYVDQIRLGERLLSVEGSTEPLIIWDVGLGAATNAMAAIHCMESLIAVKSNNLRQMHITSFECDLDSMRVAIRNAARFKHLQHSAPSAILKRGRWEHSSGLIYWDLRQGDFLELFGQASVPNLIYYDPFSFKTDQSLWRAEVFEDLFRFCTAAQPAVNGGTLLITYSASTAVRAALLNAGFFVAPGAGTGPKENTTIASTIPFSRDSEFKAFDDEWLDRWSRSGSRFPAGLPPDAEDVFAKRILSHPQFTTSRV